MSKRGRVNWRQLRLLLFPACAFVGLLVVASVAGDGPAGHANGSNTNTISGLVFTSGPCGGPSFCISSPSSGPVLYPGATPSSLPLTITNPLTVPIRVTSLTVSFTNSFPTGCAASALQVNGTGAAGTTPSVTINFASPNFSVPMESGGTPGSAIYNATLALADNHTNQDKCESLGLTMNYSASAQYTVATATNLVASPNPATLYQPVTLSATVSSTVTPASAGHQPGSSDGSVSFYQCTTNTCAIKTAIGSPVAPSGSGVATVSTTFSSQGTVYLESVFTPTDSTNYATSTSNIVSLPVGYTTVISGSQNGGLTVGSGQTVDVTSTGKVNGGITVQSGGGLVITGGTVNGGITASSGSTGINLCGANINGGATVSHATGPVVIGKPTGCAGNTISGGLTVSSNIDGVTVNGNSVTGGITISNNSGPTPSSVQYAGGNSVTGGMTCASNVASLNDNGQPNKVSGSRSGQCAGTF